MRYFAFLVLTFFIAACNKPAVPTGESIAANEPGDVSNAQVAQSQIRPAALLADDQQPRRSNSEEEQERG